MVEMKDINMDTQRDLMNVMYRTVYDDGAKVGKTEILNNLMSVVLKRKASSDVVFYLL